MSLLKVTSVANLAGTRTARVDQLVDCTSIPQIGQVPTWDGVKWIPTTPSGGGSGGAPTGPAGGVLAGVYPNPDFAEPMATLAALNTGLAGRAPLSHTHPLSNITQSGATTGQVATWNGTNWAPATPAGGGTQPPSYFSAPDFIIDANTPNSRVEFPNTNPTVWAAGHGEMRLDFEVVPNGYFAANPEGHAAIVCRCDTSLLTTTVSGQGIVIGKVLGDAGNAALYYPTTMIETWRAPNGGNKRWLYPDTDGGPGNTMVDGRRYRIIISTKKHYDNTRTIAYKRYVWDTAWNAWNCEIDTGDVLDNNTTADLTKAGIAFGTVAGSNLSAWNLAFSNIVVTWQAPSESTDSRPLLPRAGGRMGGSVWMGSYAWFVESSGTPITWTRFVDSVSGKSTKVLASPNQASGTAAWMATNSVNVSNCAYLSMGAYPTYASIHCGKEGAANSMQEIRFSIDGVRERAIIGTSAGIFAPGASLPLGRNTAILQTISGIGGPNAVALSNTLNIDIDDFCQNGHVTWYLNQGNVFNAAQADRMEGMIKAMCAAFSAAIGSARNKGCA